ncbi:hypothetical protein ACHAW6_002612 [Cyclotella cf. meneghiniana]
MPQRIRGAINTLPIIAPVTLILCITIRTLTSPSLVAAASPTSSSPTTTSPSCKVTTSLTTYNDHSKQYQDNMNSTPNYIVFSDVDGTLVHYPPHLQQHGQQHNNDDAHSESLPPSDDNPLIFLPPSKTGTRGVLSKRTLELCHQIRHGLAVGTTSPSNKEDTAHPSLKPKLQRTPFVLVSGMRTTTLFQRLPYLPRADAYVSESGGRIFYPRPSSLLQRTASDEGTVPDLVLHSVFSPSDVASHNNDVYADDDDSGPFELVEDMEWRRRISELDAAGPDGFHDASPELSLDQRAGTLWEFALRLTKQGYVLDTKGYSTAFRVNRNMQPTELMEGFDAFLKQCAERQDIPKELGCSTNLGCIDFYPVMSGKKNCCAYLAQRFLAKNSSDDESVLSSSSLLKNRAFCLCDDDNDIEMALACRAAFLPSVTSESIRKRLEMQRDDDGVQQHGRLVVTEDVDEGVVETRATERALEMILKELHTLRND